MPSAGLICVAILRVVVWASMAFVGRSTTAFASNLRAAWRARTKQELVDAARSAALFAFLVFSTALVAVVAWARIEGSSQLRVTEDQADSVLITHGAAPSWDRRAWHVVLHLAVVIAVSGLLSLSDRHPIQNSAISRKVRIATLN